MPTPTSTYRLQISRDFPLQEAAALVDYLAALGVGAFAAAVVLNFAWLYPLLAAQTLPYESWRDRIWFTSWI